MSAQVVNFYDYRLVAIRSADWSRRNARHNWPIAAREAEIIDLRPVADPAPGSMLPREWACLNRMRDAADADARRIWQNQADWAALSLRASPIYLPPLPGDVEPRLTPYDATRPASTYGVLVIGVLLIVAGLALILGAA